MPRRPQTARLGALLLSLLVVLLSSASPAQARGPSRRGHAYPPVQTRTPDAVLLAHTARQAVSNGTTDQRCTGWRSTLTPPKSIWVLRTLGPLAGHAELVPFYDPDHLSVIPDYVTTVFGAEWSSFYPYESLKVGAIAVKQYGWYYTIVYRGGVDAYGQCYDVQDNTTDQYYQPEISTPAAVHLRAMADTWRTTLRKYDRTTQNGRFILTGYRTGATTPCGTDADHWRIYQRSAYDCAKRLGMTMEQILRMYLSPHLEVVTPGAHDIVGRRFGDAAALSAGSGAAETPVVWPTGGSSVAPSGDAGFAIERAGLIGVTSADVNNDGRDDLVIVHATADSAVRIDVATSDGTAYGQPVPWYAGGIGTGVANATLMSGDLTGDGRIDVALLVKGPDPGSHSLLVFPHSAKASVFKAPLTWWTGAIDTSKGPFRAWVADMNGDGRADLLVREDLGSEGVRYSTALSLSAGGGLTALHSRLLAPDLLGSRTLEVLGDANRDGLTDLWLVIGADAQAHTSTHVDVLIATRGDRSFTRSTAWTATAADPLPVGKLKVASADVNADGFGDVVLFQQTDTGTRIVTLVANYTTLSAGVSAADAHDWTKITPY